MGQCSWSVETRGPIVDPGWYARRERLVRPARAVGTPGASGWYARRERSVRPGRRVLAPYAQGEACFLPPLTRSLAGARPGRRQRRAWRGRSASSSMGQCSWSVETRGPIVDPGWYARRERLVRPAPRYARRERSVRPARAVGTPRAPRACALRPGRGVLPSSANPEPGRGAAGTAPTARLAGAFSFVVDGAVFVECGDAGSDRGPGLVRPARAVGTPGASGWYAQGAACLRLWLSRTRAGRGRAFGHRALGAGLRLLLLVGSALVVYRLPRTLLCRAWPLAALVSVAGLSCGRVRRRWGSVRGARTRGVRS